MFKLTGSSLHEVLSHRTSILLLVKLSTRSGRRKCFLSKPIGILHFWSSPLFLFIMGTILFLPQFLVTWKTPLNLVRHLALLGFCSSQSNLLLVVPLTLPLPWLHDDCPLHLGLSLKCPLKKVFSDHFTGASFWTLCPSPLFYFTALLTI